MNDLGKALTFLVLASLVLLSSASCARQAKQDGVNKSDQIFIDASRMIGQHVTVRGYLRWTFENKNLFPLWTANDKPTQRYCLPILISNSNKELLKEVSILDGEIVTVDGVIASAAPLGMISVTNCKQVGIDVGSITKS